MTENNVFAEKIWIWGMGNAGKLVYNIWNKQNIIGLIDNGCKEKAKYNRFDIRHFEQIKDKIKKNELIICCTSLSAYTGIKIQLSAIDHTNVIHFYDLNLSKYIHESVDDGDENNIISRPCSFSDFQNDGFKTYLEQLRLGNKKIFHRKNWEWAYIAQVLDSYGCLAENKTGIGFAVGEEPLASYFASRHCNVIATDLGIENELSKVWIKTGQNAAGEINKIWDGNICSKEEFDRYVTYRNVDMNDIPSNLSGFDFCWSSCAIEHVGGLDGSINFLKNMLSCLKPGGVAVHTTEFNLSSTDETIEDGYCVIFRKKDIQNVQRWMAEHGHKMKISFKRKYCTENDYIDIPPYKSEYKPYHLALALDGYAATSYGIIIQKGNNK